MKRTIIFAIITLVCLLTAQAQAIKDVKIPPSIKPGDKIALITPASAVKSAKIDDAITWLTEMGYVPVPMPHAYGRDYGTYAATDRRRASDINKAFADTTIKAIFCTRGGYGCVRLLPYLDREVIAANPKWLVGFSDISALHAYLYNAGVASIHGVCVGHFGNDKDEDPATDELFNILNNGLPVELTVDGHKYNHPGIASGPLLGGNLAVLNCLAETDYDILNSAPGAILFFEDVDESPHSIERMLHRLHMSGALKRAGALVFGRFTNYKANDDFKSVEDMIHYWLKQWGYYRPESSTPIVFRYPVGHVFRNLPMVEGAFTTIEVTKKGVKLKMHGE